ncbi:hypothetical protein PCI56_15125 [Plesiomonas shigelloides subsp. oncorhynchi]|nr:hypothetical protein [Plesiomonas shigelloides]
MSPADVVLTVDISRVMEVVNAGLAQPLQDAVLEKISPRNTVTLMAAGLR